MSDEQNLTNNQQESETIPETKTETQPENAEKKFTQADMNEAIKVRLAREKESSKRAAEEAQKLAEAEALAKNQEWQKLAETRAAEIAAKESELKSLKLLETKRAAAEKAGLPVAFAARLQGETLEELEEDAKVIAALLPKPSKTNLGATNPGGSQTGETIEERRRRLGI